MHQMGRRMIAGCIVTSATIHRQLQPLAFTDRTGRDHAFMHDQGRHRPGGFTDLHTAIGAGQEPLIAGLSAAFCVERRDIQHHFDVVTFTRFLHRPITFDHWGDLYAIEDPAAFAATEAARLRIRYPKIPVAALLYDTAEEMLLQIEV